MGDLCSSCGSPAHDSDDCDARQPRDRKGEEIDRLTRQLAGAVADRDRWRDCARKLYAQWQAGERPPSESALGRIGFQMREPERGQ